MLKHRPIELVEAQIEQHYASVILSARGLEETADVLLDELRASSTVAATERERQEQRLLQLAAESEKLLQAHYADAIPLALLKREQDRIGRDTADAEAALKGADQNMSEIERSLSLATRRLGDCQAAYLDASPKERRLMNQAFFKRIWVTEEGVTGWEYNEPFDSLMRIHQAVQEADEVVGFTTAVQGRSD